MVVQLWYPASSNMLVDGYGLVRDKAIRDIGTSFVVLVPVAKTDMRAPCDIWKLGLESNSSIV
jgi:hypothetical protein